MDPIVGILFLVGLLEGCGPSKEKEDDAPAKVAADHPPIMTVGDHFRGNVYWGEKEKEFLNQSSELDRQFAARIFIGLREAGYPLPEAHRGYYRFGRPLSASEAREGIDGDLNECEIAEHIQNLHWQFPDDMSLTGLHDMLNHEAQTTFANVRSIKTHPLETLPRFVVRSPYFAEIALTLSESQLQRALCLNPRLADGWLTLAKQMGTTANRQSRIWALEYATLSTEPPLSGENSQRVETLLANDRAYMALRSVGASSSTLDRARQYLLGPSPAPDMSADLRRELDLYEEALRLAPSTFHFWDHHNHGVLLASAGQTEAAIEALTQAVRIGEVEMDKSPRNQALLGQTHFFLGVLHYRSHQWREAKSEFRLASDDFTKSGPDFANTYPYSECREAIRHYEREMISISK